MCGLFGFITKNGAGPDLGLLRRIAAETEQRGDHAFGLAWLAADGQVRTFKRPGAATDCLADVDRCAGASVVIGHCRWATHGNPQDNRNNHPHPAGSGWIVHNGVIRNYRGLLAEHDLAPRTECDSELLGLLMARSPGTLATRAMRAAALAEGPLAMLGLWNNPARLLVVRRGNPLHFGQTPGGFYFGSLSSQLPGQVKAVANDVVCVLTLHGTSLQFAGLRITPADVR